MRRRLAVLVSSCLPLALAACSHDGRYMRPPGPGNTYSISVPPKVTVPSEGSDADTAAGSADDGSLVDDTLDTINPDDPADGDVPLPLHGPWQNGQAIPAEYTCAGAKAFPALSWDETPAGTTAVAITLTDDDVESLLRWVVTGIPGSALSIAKNSLPAGAVVGPNDDNQKVYGAPCPPTGATHTFRYTVYFLGDPLGDVSTLDGRALLEKIDAATVATAELVGTVTGPGATTTSAPRPAGASTTKP